MYQIKQFGFSLLELMIVVTIMAMIAMFAMPSKVGEITQKRVIESIELVEPFKTNIANYYHSHNGSFPDDNADAGMPEPRKIMGNYLEKVEVRAGAMHLYLGNNIPEQLEHKIISLRPIYIKDSPQSPISWICANNDVPTGMTAAGMDLTDLDYVFLPGRCR